MTITFTNGSETVTPAGEVPGGLTEGVSVDFPAGLPGFADAHHFLLEDLGEQLRPFQRLRHTESPEIAFTVVLAGLLYPDYSVEIDEDHQVTLGITGAGEVATYVMITVPRPPQPPTANLLGPIVVNRRTGAAAQVVQHRSSYRVAEPLPTARRPA